MARLDEIAEGISSVLAGSPRPEPFFIDLMDHSPAEVTFLIRAVIDACERRGITLSAICVDNVLGSNAQRALGPKPHQYHGVYIEFATGLNRRVEFFRFPRH